MGSLNRMILTGRLAADPEVRYTANETPIANFPVAVNRNGKNGEKSVDFIRCIAWGGLAKICGEYLKKGRLIALEGRLQIRSYENKEGQKKTSTEVIADNVQMLDSKFAKATESSSSDKKETEEGTDASDELEVIEPAPAKAKKK